MKTMIIADFLYSKKQLMHIVGIFGVLSLATSFMTGGSPLIMLLIAPIMTVMTAQAFLQEGGTSGWESFRLALPLSRGQVVAGRYATFALIIAGSTLFGALLSLAVFGIQTAFPALGQFSLWQTPFDPAGIVLCFCASISGTLILIGAVLPLIMHFGAINSMRYAIAGVMVAAMLGFYALGPSGAGLIQHGRLLTQAPFGEIALLGTGLLVMSAAFFVASATIAIRLYNRRDF